MNLQGCSEQKALEVLRKTGPKVRLHLARTPLRLKDLLSPPPPRPALRHAHSCREPPLRRLNQIQETGMGARLHGACVCVWRGRKGVGGLQCFVIILTHLTLSITYCVDLTEIPSSSQWGVCVCVHVCPLGSQEPFSP